MNATQITTHVQDAQDRLLEQYKSRPNMQAFLAAFTQSVQDLENALYSIETGTSLAGTAAEGAQLDIIGQLVGVSRNGLNDTQFLALIRGTVAQNNGDATTESILTVLRGLYQTNAVFLKQPNSVRHTPQVASGTVSIAVGDPTVPDNVLPIVQAAVVSALGAGVSIGYLARFQASGCFAFAGSQPWTRGFGAPLATVLSSSASA